MKRGQKYGLWACFSVGMTKIAEVVSASASVGLISSYNEPGVVSFELRVKEEGY